MEAFFFLTVWDTDLFEWEQEDALFTDYNPQAIYLVFSNKKL